MHCFVNWGGALNGGKGASSRGGRGLRFELKKRRVGDSFFSVLPKASPKKRKWGPGGHPGNPPGGPPQPSLPFFIGLGDMGGTWRLEVLGHLFLMLHKGGTAVGPKKKPVPAFL